MFKILHILLSVTLFTGCFATEDNKSDKNRGTDAKAKEIIKTVKTKYHRYALIIGNYDYNQSCSDDRNCWEDLPGVEKDIRDINNTLLKCGYKTTVVENVKNQSQLQRVYWDFIREYGYEENNILLFYYAGHGNNIVIRDRNLSFIMPTDAIKKFSQENQKDYLSKAYNYTNILDILKKKSILSKHILFVFDSCFAGNLFRGSQNKISTVVNKEFFKKDRAIITSGGINETVPDDSTFKDAFIEGVRGDADQNKDNITTIDELIVFLKNRLNYSYNTTATRGILGYNEGTYFFTYNSALSNNRVRTYKIRKKDRCSIDTDRRTVNLKIETIPSDAIVQVLGFDKPIYMDCKDKGINVVKGERYSIVTKHKDYKRDDRFIIADGKPIYITLETIDSAKPKSVTKSDKESNKNTRLVPYFNKNSKKYYNYSEMNTTCPSGTRFPTISELKNLTTNEILESLKINDYIFYVNSNKEIYDYNCDTSRNTVSGNRYNLICIEEK